MVDPIHASRSRSTTADTELRKLEKQLAHSENTDKFEENLRFHTLWKDRTDSAECREAFQGESLAYPFEDADDVPPLSDVDVSEDEMVGSDEDGCASDVELAQQLSLEQDDSIDVSHRFRDSIDCGRYWVRYSPQYDRMSIRWKASEKGNLREKRLQVRRRIKLLHPIALS